MKTYYHNITSLFNKEGITSRFLAKVSETPKNIILKDVYVKCDDLCFDIKATIFIKLLTYKF